MTDDADTDADSIAAPFPPLVGWLASSIALLLLVAFGPKLWASQVDSNASIALNIIAVGQVFVAVIAWPIWTRTLPSGLGVIATSTVVLLLADQIESSSGGRALTMAWKVAAGLLLLAIIRAATPQRAIGVAWGSIAAAALGTPALIYLRTDY